jgi:hypothetical protein
MLAGTRLFIPWLHDLTGVEPILFWFLVAGLGVFLPMLLVALLLLRGEGVLAQPQLWDEHLAPIDEILVQRCRDTIHRVRTVESIRCSRNDRRRNPCVAGFQPDPRQAGERPCAGDCGTSTTVALPPELNRHYVLAHRELGLTSPPGRIGAKHHGARKAFVDMA